MTSGISYVHGLFLVDILHLIISAVKII